MVFLKKSLISNNILNKLLTKPSQNSEHSTIFFSRDVKRQPIFTPSGPLRRPPTAPFPMFEVKIWPTE